MARQKEFGEGLFYSFFNYVMWFFASNIYFVLCNILLVIYLISFGSDISNTYILLYVASLPVAPALTALYATVGRIIREKDISVTSFFFKSYKENFKQAFILGFIECTSILVSVIDIKFFFTLKYGKYLTSFFVILIFIVVNIGLYVFPLLSRFYLKTTDIIKFSFVNSIKKINITFLNLSTIICSAFIFYKFTSISILFIFSGTCYLIMFYQMKILNELEAKVLKAENEEDI